MPIFDFGQIADAITASKRMESRMDIGPVSSPPVQFAASQFSSSDFVANSIISSRLREKQFAWTVDKWGDPNYKVSE